MSKPEWMVELEKPFPDSCIKERKGNFGKTLSYIEVHYVVKRLNETLGEKWTFTIDRCEVITVEEKKEWVCWGKITIGGEYRSHVGNKPITYKKDSKIPLDLGSDCKAAISDCLKKCATLWGVALNLYEDDDASQDTVKKSAPSSDSSVPKKGTNVPEKGTEKSEPAQDVTFVGKITWFDPKNAEGKYFQFKVEEETGIDVVVKMLHDFSHLKEFVKYTEVRVKGKAVKKPRPKGDGTYYYMENPVVEDYSDIPF